MAIIIPFKALRPEVKYAKQVASLPYDVLSSKEAKVHAQGNSASFLHITKSEIDLPENTDTHSDKVYIKAKENLEAFMNRNILFLESKPCYYIYRLIFNDLEQTGIVCCSSIDDYENNIIKKHEFTRPEKELDRINHIRATNAQTGNVFLAYKNVSEIDSLVHSWKKDRSPVYDFKTDDNIQHTVWLINDDHVINKLTILFDKNVPCTYIADGHHRAASAAKIRQIVKPHSKEADYFLTTLFPANQLRIMDYNRVVKDLNGFDPNSFLEKLANDFFINIVDKPYAPDSSHKFGMFLQKQWYSLEVKDLVKDEENPIALLDISILESKILRPILGVADQRTDKRIDFVGGIRGLEELERRVNSGEMQVAFSLYPVRIDQLFKIADTGNVMPPKSTWFEPKLRDGLLTHMI